MPTACPDVVAACQLHKLIFFTSTKPMQHVANQLNKVKPSQHSKYPGIPADIAAFFLACIAEDAGCLAGKRIGIFEDVCGIIAVGAGLLGPESLITINTDTPDAVVAQNLGQFSIPYDAIVSAGAPLAEHSLDIAIVVPVLDKSKGVCLDSIRNAQRMARLVYALHKNEFREKLLADVPGADICGSLSLKMPGSSNYSKGANKSVLFDIVKIKGV